MRPTDPIRLALCLTFAAPAALAQTTAPDAPTLATTPAVSAGTGAVAQFMAAQDLFALGRARKDPLAALAAARLAATLAATETIRTADPAAESLPASHPDAATMFTAAKAIASEDEAMTDLILRSEAEAPRLPSRTVMRSTSGIPAGASQSYTLPFFAGAFAEIGLLGDGKSNLDLAVTTADRPLCLDTGPTDRALCTFVLPENANVTVTVTNRSETAASYSLLSN